MLQYINIGMGIRLLAETFPTSLDMIDSMLSKKSIGQWLDECAPYEMAEALVPYGSKSSIQLSSSAAQAALYLAEREEYVLTRQI
jgi:hypothetical protein